ncbi:MAG: tetratricopeptide repeat protein [Dehalococcoidia bacterium]|nr:tetratricopeptide repeat protein [Dehalococcoidia bacterium]
MLRENTMVLYEEKARLRRQKAELAINLAMQSRWEEAVKVNQGILELYPNDVDAFNRLGKALTEMGKYREALESYKNSLGLEPGNAIARKNIDRLSGMGNTTTSPESQRSRVDPGLFIEETGKTTVATLQNTAPKDILARVTAGDQVNIKVKGRSLVVETEREDYIGQIEPKLGLRLIKLLEAGNRYSAAITSLDSSGVKVIVREIFQSPTMAGRPSFPVKAASGFRSYVRDGVIKRAVDEDFDGLEDDESTDESEEDAYGFREEKGYFDERGTSEDDEDTEE